MKIFEEYLDKAPDSSSHDAIRQSVIILMGCLAKHLDKDDPKVRYFPNTSFHSFLKARKRKMNPGVITSLKFRNSFQVHPIIVKLLAALSTPSQQVSLKMTVTLKIPTAIISLSL